VGRAPESLAPGVTLRITVTASAATPSQPLVTTLTITVT
jgi:hypothetical protein